MPTVINCNTTHHLRYLLWDITSRHLVGHYSLSKINNDACSPICKSRLKVTKMMAREKKDTPGVCVAIWFSNPAIPHHNLNSNSNICETCSLGPYLVHCSQPTPYVGLNEGTEGGGDIRETYISTSFPLSVPGPDGCVYCSRIGLREAAHQSAFKTLVMCQKGRKISPELPDYISS